MAMRSALRRLNLTRSMKSTRYFSDGGKGRVLSEEELAKETVFIQKMERERLEKLKRKAEKEKAEIEKGGSEKKVEEGTHKG